AKTRHHQQDHGFVGAHFVGNPRRLRTDGRPRHVPKTFRHRSTPLRRRPTRRLNQSAVRSLSSILCLPRRSFSEGGLSELSTFSLFTFYFLQSVAISITTRYFT